MEPTEITEFSKQMKEAGEGGESLTHISLAISILAVLVAMVTVLGHRSHTEAVLAQARAADMWSHYESHKIRFDQIEANIVLLNLQPNSNGDAVEKKIEEYRTHQQKWQQQLDEEESQAHAFEADVEHAEKRALHFDIGEALLQISVVLCSVTLFTRRKLYFYFGLSVGAAGVLSAASVFLLTH
jgi:hypothetical protein